MLCGNILAPGQRGDRSGQYNGKFICLGQAGPHTEGKILVASTLKVSKDCPGPVSSTELRESEIWSDVYNGYRICLC